MPARRMNGTYRTPQAAHARVLAAQAELSTQAALRAQTQDDCEAEAETEPMRRWPHPIPTSTSTCSACCACGGDAELMETLTQALEKLQYQSQVLTDLLAAVNSLTAAVLCQKSPGGGEEA